MTQHCGIIAIIGEPNAGKSTLINQLVGGKVSIVSPKVQTTRFNVRGVCSEGDAQLIFVDTPGIFAAEKKFEKAMVQAAWNGINDADVAVLLLDAETGLRERGKAVIEKLASVKKPIFLALNKVDRIAKPSLFALATECAVHDFFQKIFMISALSGDGVADLKHTVAAQLPAGPWLYPADEMSDVPMRLLAAEITREKLFYFLDQELPYAVHVETESWEETATSIKIAQVIMVQREGQKKIVLGNKGEMIKRVGTASRKEISYIAEKPVHLTLFVKVSPHWKDHPDFYH